EREHAGRLDPERIREHERRIGRPAAALAPTPLPRPWRGGVLTAHQHRRRAGVRTRAPPGPPAPLPRAPPRPPAPPRRHAAPPPARAPAAPADDPRPSTRSRPTAGAAPCREARPTAGR